MIVLLKIDETLKWLGWSMVAVSMAALVSFAIISAINDGDI
jgi:hypothetical protein